MSSYAQEVARRREAAIRREPVTGQQMGLGGLLHGLARTGALATAGGSGLGYFDAVTNRLGGGAVLDPYMYPPMAGGVIRKLPANVIPLGRNYVSEEGKTMVGEHLLDLQRMGKAAPLASKVRSGLSEPTQFGRGGDVTPAMMQNRRQLTNRDVPSVRQMAPVRRQPTPRPAPSPLAGKIALERRAREQERALLDARRAEYLKDVEKMVAQSRREAVIRRGGR